LGRNVARKRAYEISGRTKLESRLRLRSHRLGRVVLLYRGEELDSMEGMMTAHVDRALKQEFGL
jgi:hypothetical protein